MEIFGGGNAPSSNGMHHDASGAVTTTLDSPDGGEALLQSPRVENRNDLLATLSLVLGSGAAPIVCCVIVSPHSMTASFSRAGDIDADLISLAQRYLAYLQARNEPSPQLAEGWSEFYQECQPIVTQTIRRCGLRGADLEDCSQDVWKRISQALIYFVYDPTRGRFWDWFTVLVRREASRYRRLAIARSLREQRMVEMNVVAGAGDDPVADHQRHELHERVGKALSIFRGRVSVINYRIVQGYWLKGLSLAEIAEQTGLTYEQVRWRHQRLRRKLHDALKPLVMKPE